MKNKSKIFLPILSGFLFLSLIGCSYVRPYHVPVQQGNVLEAKTVQQLAIGMSKSEVEDLLGAPVLRNAFADNYWTYVYTNQPTCNKFEQKELTVYFVNNRLARIEKKNI